MTAVVELKDLVVTYSRTEAVRGLNLEVQPGRCHALFGRNGAGKTSTLRALLGLLHPSRGTLRLFGLDPRAHEAQVKERMAWVPDAPAFHGWMTVREVLAWHRSLRTRWADDVQEHLLTRFELDGNAPASSLSKGMRTQLALVCALAADPELLVLDEPTSGLDPLVRKQFLEAVIGVFQDRDPEKKAILVSTHLITEFEGVVDDFTVMSGGKAVLTATADDARSRFCRLQAWFDGDAPATVPMKTVKPPRREGRMLELVLDDARDEAQRWLTGAGAVKVDTSALTLEDIFLLAA